MQRRQEAKKAADERLEAATAAAQEMLRGLSTEDLQRLSASRGAAIRDALNRALQDHSHVEALKSELDGLKTEALGVSRDLASDEELLAKVEEAQDPDGDEWDRGRRRSEIIKRMRDRRGRLGHISNVIGEVATRLKEEEGKLK